MRTAPALQDRRLRSVPTEYRPRRVLADLWPIVPAVDAGQVYWVLNQMLADEWCDPGVLRARQLVQLRALLRHAAQYSPFHAERIRASRIDADAMSGVEELRGLPLMTRTDLQDHFENIRSTSLPPGHRPGGERSTSGSSGSPVRVLKTNVSQLFFMASMARSALWCGDPCWTLGSIRHLDKATHPAAHEPSGGRLDNWLAPFASGSVYMMDIAQEVDNQIDMLERANPEILLSYPTNLVMLGRRMVELGLQLGRLRLISTISEVLPQETRREIENLFGVPVFDSYSCIEAGYIATNCPTASPAYHVEENVILEVLDEDNRPCAPGEVGRVVITLLTNYAFPLIRYDVGDYAETAREERCVCGRGLECLARIIGRQRGQLVDMTGKVRFSSPLSIAMRDAGKIRQFQVTQHARDRVEVVIVPMQGFGEAEQGRITGAIKDYLGAGVVVTFRLVERIPRTPGGKYLDFICRAT